MKIFIISAKNEKVKEILRIIILFMLDETFSAEWFCFETRIEILTLSKYSLNYKYYNKNNILWVALIKSLKFVNVFYSTYVT